MDSLFYSLAPHLKNERGHYLTYHLAMQRVISSLSLPFQAFVGRDATIDLPHNWKKHFSDRDISLRAFFKRIKEFKQIFSLKKEGKRIFFLEYFNLLDFSAFFLASLFFAQKNDRLLLLFRDDFPHTQVTETIYSFFASSRIKTTLYSLMVRILNLKLKNRLICLTDSSLVASYFTPLFRKPFCVLPIPHTEMGENSKEPKTTDKITALWPGMPRPTKGLKEIQKLMYLKDPKKSEFQLAFSKDAPLLSSDMPIKYIEASLSREDYLRELFSADVVLLPYDPVMYRISTSGILVEAVVAGKIPLVKEGSWLAHELKSNNLSELIVDWEDPLFFTHLCELKENKEMLSKLEKMRTSYCNFHSMDTFQKKFREVLSSD